MLIAFHSQNKENDMIEIDQLTYSWNGSPPWMLEQLNLTIENGSYISVIGENGSGKSTLIRLILGFLKPVSGTIRVGTSAIGYVPQRPELENRGFPITVEELLNTQRRVKRLSASRVDLVLEQARLVEQRKQRVGDLSGGQWQRIAIAQALLSLPKLLILDEPSTGIDAANQKEIYALLNCLNQKEGTTIVSVEHNLDAAITNSTLIYHLRSGKGHLCTPDQFSEEIKQGRIG